jgi:hypothetical protein
VPWDVEDRDLLVTHPLKPDDQDQLTRLLGEGRASPVRGLVFGGKSPAWEPVCQNWRDIFHSNSDPVAGRAANLIDVLIVEKREQPSAWRSAPQRSNIVNL